MVLKHKRGHSHQRSLDDYLGEDVPQQFQTGMSLGAIDPEFFAKLLQVSSDKILSDTTETTVDFNSVDTVVKGKSKKKNRKMCQDGKWRKKCEDGIWRTYPEIRQTQRLRRLECQELEKQVFSIQNVDQNNQLLSYKPKMSEFEKENKVVKVIGRFNQHKISQLTDGTKFRYPFATHAEQKCLRDGKPIGQSKK
jgi:hypothetical protein